MKQKYKKNKKAYKSLKLVYSMGKQHQEHSREYTKIWHGIGIQTRYKQNPKHEQCKFCHKTDSYIDRVMSKSNPKTLNSTKLVSGMVFESSCFVIGVIKNDSLLLFPEN